MIFQGSQKFKKIIKKQDFDYFANISSETHPNLKLFSVLDSVCSWILTIVSFIKMYQIRIRYHLRPKSGLKIEER